MKVLDGIVWNLAPTGEWIVVGRVRKGVDGTYIEWFE